MDTRTVHVTHTPKRIDVCLGVDFHATVETQSELIEVIGDLGFPSDHPVIVSVESGRNYNLVVRDFTAKETTA